jgi:hypothetical protein
MHMREIVIPKLKDFYCHVVLYRLIISVVATIVTISSEEFSGHIIF